MDSSYSQQAIVLILCQQLTCEAEIIVREEIILQLGEIGDELAIPILMQLLQQDPNPNSRKLAAQALGKTHQKIEDRQILSLKILALKQLIIDWQTTYPDPRKVTDSSIIDLEFTPIPDKDPQKWQGMMDVLSVVFAGGVEGVKIFFPVAGIPIEVAKRLYEIYDRLKKP